MIVFVKWGKRLRLYGSIFPDYSLKKDKRNDIFCAKHMRVSNSITAGSGRMTMITEYLLI